MTRTVAVIGGGWAGIAAAVEATAAGHRVALFEMAAQLGGRARSLADGRDSGQHILIGAYRDTLALMRRVGADPDALLLRTPLALRGPRDAGLRLPPGAPLVAFARGVLAHPRWPLGARVALLAQATRWLLGGFQCAPRLSVAELCAPLPAVVLAELVEPLCVAALNTPMAEASAPVFLRVLHDALFAGRGGADLLLPRVPLAALVAQPAEAWLRARGAALHLGRRIQSLDELDAVDAFDARDARRGFDRIVIATTSGEAARLVAPLGAAWTRWAARARALRFEPIATAYVEYSGRGLPEPMLMLGDGPAQFVFDLGRLGLGAGLYAFSISAAAPWVERGLDATGAAVIEQARAELGWDGARVARVLAEKRATFACTPGLARPPASADPHIRVAGDYVAGPYPATLEGAVRSGRAAVADLLPPR